MYLKLKEIYELYFVSHRMTASICVCLHKFNFFRADHVKLYSSNSKIVLPSASNEIRISETVTIQLSTRLLPEIGIHNLNSIAKIGKLKSLSIETYSGMIFARTKLSVFHFLFATSILDQSLNRYCYYLFNNCFVNRRQIFS